MSDVASVVQTSQLKDVDGGVTDKDGFGRIGVWSLNCSLDEMRPGLEAGRGRDRAKYALTAR